MLIPQPLSSFLSSSFVFFYLPTATFIYISEKLKESYKTLETTSVYTKVSLIQREKHDLETRVNQLTERADMTDKKIKGQEAVTLALRDSKIELFGIVGNDRVFFKD